MASAADIADAAGKIREAADLILQPLLVEVLVATGSSRSPRHAARHGDPTVDPALASRLIAAIERLAEIGAVRTVDAADPAAWDKPLSMTARGVRLLNLICEPGTNSQTGDPNRPTQQALSGTCSGDKGSV